MDVDFAEIAPDGSFALTARNGFVHVIRGMRNAQPEDTLLEGAITDPERFALAGSIAAIYTEETGQAQVVRGLPDRPTVSVPIDFSSLPGRVSALAIAGDELVAGVTSGSGVEYEFLTRYCANLKVTLAVLCSQP